LLDCLHAAGVEAGCSLLEARGELPYPLIAQYHDEILH